MSETIQHRFNTALSDGSVPEGLSSWNLDRPPRRFRIYRDNVRIGLVRALASRFPAAERIVGAAFFAAMAEDFARHCPPRSPVLLTYGDLFPDFVAGYEPARSVPYLPDVIRIEVARGRAYHAEDRAALDPQLLSAIPPERLGALRLALHPSAGVLRSPFPALTIWAMNAGDAPVTPIAEWRGEDTLVLRPEMAVTATRLPSGAADLLEALAGGLPLGEAAERALAANSDFDLSAGLAVVLGAGAFLPLTTAEGE